MRVISKFALCAALAVGGALLVAPVIGGAEGSESKPAAPAQAPAVNAQPAVSATEKMKALEAYVGVWRVENATSKDAADYATVTYEWGPGRASIFATTTFHKGGTATDYGRGVIAWHPQRKQYVLSVYSADGTIAEGIVLPDGARTIWEWTNLNAGGSREFRQVLTLNEARDAYSWDVTYRDGAEWKSAKLDNSAVFRKQEQKPTAPDAPPTDK